MDEERWPLKPLCKGMPRKEITSLLSGRLIDLRLTRRDAYTYWAHEVPIRECGKERRIDFMQFVPYGHNANITAAGVELGTFVCYEVKSCIADMKSGNGLNFFGDVNWIVCPIEVYYEFLENHQYDPKLRAVIDDQVGFLVFGSRRGESDFLEFGPPSLCRGQRKRSASELIFCMMRALVANSCHSDVDHRIEGRFLGV